VKNYFVLLGLKEAYDIDLKILEKQYFTMQAKYHPDRALKHGEKEHYLLIATELNKAYYTLKDELKRAEYILLLHGINFHDREMRSKVSSTELSIFLDTAEIIENTQEFAELEKINSQYRLIYGKEIQNLIKMFQKHNLSEASVIASKLKYIKTLLNNLQAKMKLCK
jgi:molecular chaperone HscB